MTNILHSFLFPNLNGFVRATDVQMKSSAIATVTDRTSAHSPDDKVSVIIGNGDHHIGHIVWSVQMALHSRPEGNKQAYHWCVTVVKQKPFF